MAKVPDKNYWLGKEAFENRDYKKAEGYFNKFIESGSDFADVYNMLGLMHHEEGKLEKAIRSFEKALVINPYYTEASINLAVVYSDIGKFTQAIEVYENAKKRASAKAPISGLDPYSTGKLSNLHSDLADIYISMGIYDEAIDEYQKALRLSPDFVDIRTKLGIALRDSDKITDASKELKKALSIRPDYIPASLALGLCYFKMGNKEEARKIWNKILKKKPENKTASFYLKMLES